MTPYTNLMPAFVAYLLENFPKTKPQRKNLHTKIRDNQSIEEQLL